jgi:hypothetical protein
MPFFTAEITQGNTASHLLSYMGMNRVRAMADVVPLFSRCVSRYDSRAYMIVCINIPGQRISMYQSEGTSRL